MGVFGTVRRFRRPLAVGVIACWVALAVVLPLTIPTLKEMSERTSGGHPARRRPANVASKAMTEAFKQSGSDSVLVVVLSDDKGLGRADEADLPGTRRNASRQDNR